MGRGDGGEGGREGGREGGGREGWRGREEGGRELGGREGGEADGETQGEWKIVRREEGNFPLSLCVFFSPCVRVNVCVCARGCECVCVCARVRACVRVHRASPGTSRCCPCVIKDTDSKCARVCAPSQSWYQPMLSAIRCSTSHPSHLPTSPVTSTPDPEQGEGSSQVTARLPARPRA